ncbi:unnamed protein product [Brachionus calyciflorus]|uniref:Uncharacterized protein n=1 Tax=Brachionus calyciflorus TaxID=104777 RepID=A0A814AQM7_9BILA|nr:unnamed protein product [Brachionus calyciflorus]
MPVGLYVNNSTIDTNDSNIKNVLSQIYSSSSSTSSESSSSENRLDSRQVVFVVLTPNDLNNFQNSPKLNDLSILSQLNDLQFPSSNNSSIDTHLILNKENNSNDLININNNHTPTPTTTTTTNNNNNNNYNNNDYNINNSNSDNINTNFNSRGQISIDDDNLLLNDSNLNFELDRNNTNKYKKNGDTPLINSKNNIDYAIDAVVAKYREEENREQNVGNQESVIPQNNVNNNFKKLCKKSAKLEIAPLENLNIASLDSQSKSTKARTSYISSLIAKRDISSEIRDERPNSTENKNKNIQTILSSNKSCKTSSHQVLIQPKPEFKQSNIISKNFIQNDNQSIIDFTLNSKKIPKQSNSSNNSNLINLLSKSNESITSIYFLDNDKLEKNLLNSRSDKKLIQIDLIKISDLKLKNDITEQSNSDRKETKSKPVKKLIKTKRKIEETISIDLVKSEESQSPTNYFLSQAKPKKLKTIADIVKHQNETNNQNQEQLTNSIMFNNINNIDKKFNQNIINFNEQNTNQSELHQDNNLFKGEDLTITWINQNHLINNNINQHLNQNSNQHDQINMDNLLELELDTENNSPIEKFIDLDDIDVNPLDCYRSGATNENQNVRCNQNLLHSNTSLDEFNLQFSVCSSTSSGFSEPSNFSCSSSMSSASNLSYGNCGSNVMSVNSINTCLFSPDEPSPSAYQSYENHHSPNSLFQQNNFHISSNKNTHGLNNIDWNLSEFHVKNQNTINSSNNSANVNCNENMFANFNFFNDEIKLEI